MTVYPDTTGSALEINGKFLAARMTGVHRVALELVRQLGSRTEELAHLFGGPATIRAPRNARPYDLPASLRLCSRSLMTGQPWQQLELPARARGNVLLNLCNLAPVLSAQSITMIHDAQTFSTPSSYTRDFVTFYKLVQPIVSHRALRILTVSNFSASELVKWKLAPAEKIRVIHNGVDHRSDAVPDRSIVARLHLSGRRYVVALSSAQAHKNIKVLLAAFADCSLRDIGLVLFGSDGRADLVRAGLTIPPNVVFTGWLSDGELRALMEGAVCFAMPSLTEGFGLPQLEAMAVGCPAVVSTAGALAEVCGDATLYASPLMPDHWRSAIHAFVEHAELRAAYADRGRRQAALFTWQRAGDALMTVLREVAADLGPVPARRIHDLAEI